MSKFLRYTGIVVIVSFLYANFVWAGGLPIETLAQDSGSILAGILRQPPDKIEAGFEAFSKRRAVDKKSIFSELARAITINISSSELLAVYKKILFSIFSSELENIGENAASIAGAGENNIRLQASGEFYNLTWDNKLVITQETKPDMPGTAISRKGAVKGTLLLILGVVAIAVFGLILFFKSDYESNDTIRQASAQDAGITQTDTPLPPTQAQSPLVSSPGVPLTDADVNDIVRRFDAWLARISQTRTGLPPSHVGDTRPVALQHGFSTGGFTYDLAQLALRLVREGKFQEARRIIFYFSDRFNRYTDEQLTDMVDRNNVYGILRYLPSPRDGRRRLYIVNCIDTSSSWGQGNGIIEWYTDGGPMAWLGMAVVQELMSDNGLSNSQKAELEMFLRRLTDSIIGLFDDTGDYGTIVSAGPLLQRTNPREYEREDRGHIENMWDIYALLKQLEGYFQRNSPRDARTYRERADSILTGLRRKSILVRDRDTAYFWQGFIDGEINRQIPTDVQAWGILAVGPRELNRVFGAGTAEGMLNWLVRHALVLTDYTRPDGYRVTTVGADFSDPHLPDMRRERNGIRAQITDEWTSGVILAMEVMANYYFEEGQTQRAEEVLAMADALKWFALQRTVQVEDMQYWEYSTEPDMPTGYGWNTPDANGGSLAGNQMLLALLDINFFDPEGRSMRGVQRIRRKGIEEGMRLVLKRMNQGNRFSRNPVARPGGTLQRVAQPDMPWASLRGGGQEIVLTDPSILRKISFYSARGEDIGRLHSSRNSIGIRTAADWNSAEVSFTRNLNLTRTSVLKLDVKAGPGARKLRISVIDSAYIGRQDWTIPPPYIEISMPGDNAWHTYTVDLSRAHGANLGEVAAISFEVGTATTESRMGAEFFFRNYRFIGSQGQPTHEGTAPQGMEGPAGRTDEVPGRGIAGEGRATSGSRGEAEDRAEVICNGSCPQGWGGVAYFKDGSWELSDNDIIEVTVQGSGEYILRLVGEDQSYDNPNMHSRPLRMGETYRIRFRDLRGNREHDIKQVGINTSTNLFGTAPGSQGGTAERVTIRIIKGSHTLLKRPIRTQMAGTIPFLTQIIAVLNTIISFIFRKLGIKKRPSRLSARYGRGNTPTDSKERKSSARRPPPQQTGTARGHPTMPPPSRIRAGGVAPSGAQSLRDITPRKRGGPRTKAWMGNVLDIGVIGKGLKTMADHGEWTKAGNYLIADSDIHCIFAATGITYDITHSMEQSYFAVKITKDNVTTEKKVFAMPLGDGEILIPSKLYRILKEETRTQLSSHEDFEQISGEERIALLNRVFSGFQTEEDKVDFIGLWRRVGIRLLFTDGAITGMEPLTKEAGLFSGHIGGEIMELVNEYLRGRKAGLYRRFSDVSLSSLDATLLGVRLSEILDIDVDVNNFVQKLVSPNNTTQIVLGMVSDGRINLELVEKALDAVQEADDGITALGDHTTKAVLVLGSLLAWEDREMGKLADVLGKDVCNKLINGLSKNGYNQSFEGIRNLLSYIRSELGRGARVKGGRIRVNSPYLHALIVKIAGMAGIEPHLLLEAYYNDLISGEETTNIVKNRLVKAGVENALVEAGIVDKKGLLGYESSVSQGLVEKVRKLATDMYKKGISDTTEPLNPIDLVMDVDRDKDPLGVIEDILLSGPFTGKLNCARTGINFSGLAPLLELLNLDNTAQRGAYVLPDTLKAEKRLDTLVISLEHLFTIENINPETGAIVIAPKALGIAEKIREILNSGGKIKIAAKGGEQSVIQEAVEKYLGFENNNLTIEVKGIEEIINGLSSPKDSTLILTQEDAEGLTKNRGAFVYVPQAGELLGDVITVVTSISLTPEGRFIEESRQILIDYLEKQVPGIEQTDIWLEVLTSLDGFNNTCIIYFTLPAVVKFTEKLGELQFYRITVLIAA